MADNQNADFGSNGTNTFNARFSGGYHLTGGPIRGDGSGLSNVTALFAASAAYATSAGSAPPDNDWTVSGTNVHRSTGSVGIGTANPTATLHVQGSMKIGENGKSILEFRELSGTTASGNRTKLSLPNGWTAGTCVILYVAVHCSVGAPYSGWNFSVVDEALVNTDENNIWLTHSSEITRSRWYRIGLLRVNLSDP